MAAVIGCCGQNYHRSRQIDDDTHNEVVVPEDVRISLALEILAYRSHIIVGTLLSVLLHQEPSGACVEAQDVVQQPPGIPVQNARKLNEERAQALPSPFVRASVTGNAERHVGWDDGGLQVRVQG